MRVLCTVLGLLISISNLVHASTGCNCTGPLTVDYRNSLVPDAAQDAVMSIALDTNSWKVVFTVTDIRTVTNGHVVAGPIDARLGFDAAVAGLTQPYNTSDIWNPPACGLGPLDTPASSLGIAVGVSEDCIRNYTIEFSLMDAAQRTSHCQLTNTIDEQLLVECVLEISTIRAYDESESTKLLAKENVFRGNITMPRNLPNDVKTLLHASLAKCSVFAAPYFYLDCRIPSLWHFARNFTVEQTPDWIIESSCDQTNSTDATYIRCDLQSISQIYTEAEATISATQLPSGEQMKFNVNYSLPREETATASGSLASFIKTIGTKDGKFFYGNDDLMTLEIEVVDTSRLVITSLELFNSDFPPQSYDLRAHPEFETVETQNATYFVITCYPARMIRDSNFYRQGPHGINVSFLFTAAARRQEGGDGEAPTSGDRGVVTFKGMGLKVPSSNGQTGVAPTSGISQTAVAAIAGLALVAVVGLVAGMVLLYRRATHQVQLDRKKYVQRDPAEPPRRIREDDV